MRITSRQVEDIELPTNGHFYVCSSGLKMNEWGESAGRFWDFEIDWQWHMVAKESSTCDIRDKVDHYLTLVGNDLEFFVSSTHTQSTAASWICRNNIRSSQPWQYEIVNCHLMSNLRTFLGDLQPGIDAVFFVVLYYACIMLTQRQPS